MFVYNKISFFACKIRNYFGVYVISSIKHFVFNVFYSFENKSEFILHFAQFVLPLPAICRN